MLCMSGCSETRIAQASAWGWVDAVVRCCGYQDVYSLNGICSITWAKKKHRQCHSCAPAATGSIPTSWCRRGAPADTCNQRLYEGKGEGSSSQVEL